MDAFCRSLERFPWNVSSLVNRNLRTILAAFGNITPSSCQVFWEHYTIDLLTYSSTVRITNILFVWYQSTGISPCSYSFSLVTLTFLIMSSSAPRFFNQSWYSLCRSLRKNTNVFWSPRIFSWTTLTTSDRDIPANSKKLKSITLLKIDAQGSLSCSWY